MFADGIPNKAHYIDTIMSAIKAINDKTCVRIIERTTQTDYIKIGNINGCWSYIGNHVKLGAQVGLTRDDVRDYYRLLEIYRDYYIMVSLETVCNVTV